MIFAPEPSDQFGADKTRGTGNNQIHSKLLTLG
jgi:hypothetical protein